MEHDAIRVVQILCRVGVANMYCDPEVDAMFVVEQFEKGGSQLCAKIVQIDVEIGIM